MTLTIIGAGNPSAESSSAKEFTNLIRVGRRLAVLGVADTGTEQDLKWWHVVNPGTYNVPQVGAMSRQSGSWGLTYARAMCGRRVLSNGYAADWRPPKGALCPACSERL